MNFLVLISVCHEMLFFFVTSCIEYKSNVKFLLFSSNEIDDVNDIFPKLSAYLQLASNSALKGAPNAKSKTPPLLDIKTSPPSSPSSESSINVATTNVSSNTSISSTVATSVKNTSSTTTISGNKISLVPTKILMKPSTAVRAIHFN